MSTLNIVHEEHGYRLYQDILILPTKKPRYETLKKL